MLRVTGKRDTQGFTDASEVRRCRAGTATARCTARSCARRRASSTDHGWPVVEESDEHAAAGHRPSGRRTGGAGRAAVERSAPRCGTPVRWCRWRPPRPVPGGTRSSPAPSCRPSWPRPTAWCGTPPGDAVLAPPSEVPDGWVHWRVAPALMRLPGRPRRPDLPRRAGRRARPRRRRVTPGRPAARRGGRGGHAVLARPRAGGRLAPVDAARRAAPGAPASRRCGARAGPPRDRGSPVAQPHHERGRGRRNTTDPGQYHLPARRRRSGAPSPPRGQHGGPVPLPAGPGRRRVRPQARGVEVRTGAARTDDRGARTRAGLTPRTPCLRAGGHYGFVAISESPRSDAPTRHGSADRDRRP